MNQEFLAQWLEWLRDPNSKQVTRQLEMVDEEGNLIGNCCMGGLCRIAIRNGLKLKVTPRSWNSSIAFNDHTALLPEEVVEWMGVEPYSDFVLPFRDRRGEQVSAYYLNDEGFTFPQIADVLEYVFKER